MDLSLVIACFNSEKFLEENVKKIDRFLKLTRFEYEFIFVEDKSTDNTAMVVKKLHKQFPNSQVLFHQKNTGRGKTVADGIRISSGKVAGFIDIDLETPEIYIPGLVQAILEGADVATAYRIYKFKLSGLPRWIMSKGYKFMVRLMLDLPLQDTETGCKFFNREKILPLLDEIASTHWFWDTEIMYFAYKRGLKIVEIPTLFIRRPELGSTVHPIRDSIVQFKELLKLKRRISSLK